MNYRKALTVFSTVVLIFYIYFNRTPDRLFDDYNKEVILSPCDGLVTHSDKRKISIFLNLFDVHAQYTPIDSVIKSTEIIEGKYHMANTPESDHNHGVKVIFSSIHGDIEVTQRVGFFVRRIVNYIKPGESVNRGIPYGKINFGSRVDILLPENKESILSNLQPIYAGITRLC